MEYLRSDLIVSHIRELGFKVRDPVRHAQLRTLFAERNYTKMVRLVRDSLNVPVRIRVGIINQGGPRKDNPAWIEYRDPMPKFGTDALARSLVTLYMRRQFLETVTYPAAVTIIAHEISHIILEALPHPLRTSEEAVDLTAMMLGYRDFYRLSCTAEERDGILFYERNGYLSPQEVNFAANLMAAM